MELTLWLSIFAGSTLGWFLLWLFLVYRYGFPKFIKDVRSIFEGEDKEDARLSYGRVFTFVFLIPAFILIGYSVRKFAVGSSWQIFGGSLIAVIAALAPYLISKVAEVQTLIEALKGSRNVCSKGSENDDN